MEFRTVITAGKEVLFVGHERGNSKPADDWLKAGRWKIAMSAFDSYLTEKLRAKSFGTSIDRFVFCFEIADFELWGNLFQASADYTSYRPKKKEIWSVGQLRWTDVRDLQASDQLRVLRGAVLAAIHRIGRKPRKPRDFEHAAFASTVEILLAQAPEELLVAKAAA
ncbi:hypothetical protein [Bradyrhizobium sp.]|uniref:hypothetical protein n=1 Tax=Bradyrhizobium sp. TaxID=376 RepID=UPI003C74269E